MKVKLLGSNFLSHLEFKINDFIKDKVVIDIKFENFNNYFSCMIIYR